MVVWLHVSAFVGVMFGNSVCVSFCGKGFAMGVLTGYWSIFVVRFRLLSCRSACVMGPQGWQWSALDKHWLFLVDGSLHVVVLSSWSDLVWFGSLPSNK